MITIAVLGTLDTKGPEHAFVAEQIRRLGAAALLIDVGTAGAPTVVPDVQREEIVDAARLSASTDRGSAIALMVQQLPARLRQWVDEGRIHGVISLGGSGGTAIATAAMRALPLGFPKVMVSTMASGNVAPYLGVSDIQMIPSIVDVSGLNRVTKPVFTRAAAAVVALARVNEQPQTPDDQRPLIVASMFGNTTRCVEQAKSILEQAGYEVLVFHATGVGGRTMEALIDSGIVAGVLDLTTTEWADQIVGGVMPGGESRLEAAARRGVPAVVAPGCLDMVNFGTRETVPTHFSQRTFYQHNPQVTLMRTTAAECREIGYAIAARLNQSVGPVEFLFPRRAISVISAAGQPFHDPVADAALFDALRERLRPDVPLRQYDLEINDPEFARQAAERLLTLCGQSLLS